MDTLKQIRNTMKSFEGRMKALEHDQNIDLETYCTKASGLEHEFYGVIKRILDNSDEKENISSVALAQRFGLTDTKDL